MVIFFLLIILTPHAGNDPDKLTLGGQRPYKTLEACQDDAQRMMNWLTQDLVTAEFQCLRKEIRDYTHKYEG